MTEVEFGALSVGSPGQGARMATAAEHDGYDIALFAGEVLPALRG